MMKKIISLIVATVVFMSVIFSGSFETHADEPKDITGHVTIDSVIIYNLHGNTDWEPIDADDTFVSGMTLKLEVKWQIKEDDMNGINANDTFTIPVDNSHMSLNDTPVKALLDGDDREVGSWQIIDNEIIATLNNDGANALFLKDGYFRVYFQIFGEGEDIELNIGGQLVPPINVEPNGGSSVDTPVGSLPHFDKSGGQIGFTKDTNWTININDDNFLKLYQDQNATIPTLNNVLLIDELPATFEFIDDSIEIVGYVPHPYDGTGSGNLVTDMLAGEPLFARGFTDKFAVVRNEVGEAQDVFQGRIHGATVPTIGIFNNSVLFISFGNLPGTGTSFEYFESDSALRDYLSGTDMSAAQQQIMFDMLSKTGPLNGNAISFRVKYNMRSNNDTPLSEITNTATLIYNNEVKDESEFTVKYQWEEGGVGVGEPRSVTLEKLEHGTNKPIENVGFKLQIWDKDTGVFVDFTAPSQDLVKYTDDTGRLTFTNLITGKYKIVEVSKPAGYTDEITFDPGTDVFDIIGTEIATIKYKVYNYKDDTIPETINISGHKTWNDANDQDGLRPEKIIVNLVVDNKVINTTEANASTGWNFSFNDLPKYNDDGEIQYSITENPVYGYSTNIVGNTEDGYEIINTHIPETVSITGTKVWNDSNNKDKIRPNEITVNLVVDGEVIETTTTNEASGWNFSFSNLPKFADGREIKYEIVEVTVKGYTTIITGDIDSGFTITNTHVPPETPELPGTGHSNRNIILFGLLIMTAGVVVLTYDVRKRNKG